MIEMINVIRFSVVYLGGGGVSLFISLLCSQDNAVF